jgi:hypothetical protein
VTRRCTADQHGPIVDGDPRDLGDCVNVDWICGSCGLVLGEVSWTREAWEAKFTQTANRVLKRRRAALAKLGR